MLVFSQGRICVAKLTFCSFLNLSLRNICCFQAEVAGELDSCKMHEPGSAKLALALPHTYVIQQSTDNVDNDNCRQVLKINFSYEILQGIHWVWSVGKYCTA